MFYGWRIVGVAFVTHFISVGFIFYSYGVFQDHLITGLNSNRFEVSIGLSLMNVANGLFAPFLGRLLDRYSTRLIMCIGATSMAAGLYLASRITEVWHLYLLLGTVLGLGAGAIGAIPSTGIVANWFIKQRGKALGISTMGVSLSGMVMVPLSAQLIHTYGWRETFVIYSVITLVAVVPLVWLVVVKRPEDMGQCPDGDCPEDQARPEDATEPVIPVGSGDTFLDHPGHLEWSTLRALREPNFWAIVIAVGLNFFGLSAILTHMVQHALDLGFSPTREAPFIVAVSAGVGVIGKVLFGWITDHTSTRSAFWLAIAFEAVGTIMMIGGTSFGIIVAAASIFGFGMGGVVPIYASLVADYFGRKSFGRVTGMMSVCMLPIQTTGVPLAGYIADRTGNYDLAYGIFTGTFVLSALVLVILDKTRLHDERI